MTLQFFIVMIASAINDRLQRRVVCRSRPRDRSVIRPLPRPTRPASLYTAYGPISHSGHGSSRLPCARPLLWSYVPPDYLAETQGATLLSTVCRLASIALVLFVSTNLYAAEPPTEETKVHVRKATAAYNLGKYAEAAKDYEAAYEQTLDSNLLFNVAQSYRMAGEREKAITAYRSFLRSAPKSEQRGLAESKIRELEGQRASTPTPAASPVTPPVAPAAPPTLPPTQGAGADKSGGPAHAGASASGVAQPDRPNPLLTVPAQTTEPPSPFYKRWPFWTALGVAVAGGATLGIVLATRGHDLTMPNNTKEY